MLDGGRCGVLPVCESADSDAFRKERCVWFLDFAIRLLSDPQWSKRRHSPARRTSKCAREISRNLQHTLQREGTTTDTVRGTIAMDRQSPMVSSAS